MRPLNALKPIQKGNSENKGAMTITFSVWLLCMGAIYLIPKILHESSNGLEMFCYLYMILSPPGLVLMLWLEGRRLEKLENVRK